MADKIHWRPAYRAGMELTLWAYRDVLEYRDEIPLGKEPPKMDPLIIKKRPDVVIDKNFGHLFRTYNVIEYKSPTDTPNINDFFQLLLYVSAYKTIGKTLNAIPADEITGSIFHHGHPGNLFNQLRDHGLNVTQNCPGVYYLTGFPLFPIQIVVCQELPHGEYAALRALTFHAEAQDLRDFLMQSDSNTAPAYRSNVDAVLYASMKANMKMFKEIGGEETMNEVMRELMRDDLVKAENIGLARGIEQGMAQEREAMAKRMIQNHQPADKITLFTNVQRPRLKELAEQIDVPLAPPS